jgi:hypothetical protein
MPRGSQNLVSGVRSTHIRPDQASWSGSDTLAKVERRKSGRSLEAEFALIKSLENGVGIGACLSGRSEYVRNLMKAAARKIKRLRKELNEASP